MFVERRKDNYDELQILAGDVRTRRRRTNFWTTTLVVGSMAATALYVSTTSQQVDELKNEKQAAEEERDQLRPIVIRLTDERDALKAERDIFKVLADRNADYSDNKYIGDTINNIADALNPGAAKAGPVFADVVWLVEGSRRFPMAENDFLWIPDATMWIKMEDLDDPGTIRVFRDRDATNRPNNDVLGDTRTLPLQISNYKRGSSDHLCLTLHKPSTRPGFQNEAYGDIEILFQSGECRTSPGVRIETLNLQAGPATPDPEN